MTVNELITALEKLDGMSQILIHAKLVDNGPFGGFKGAPSFIGTVCGVKDSKILIEIEERNEI